MDEKRVLIAIALSILIMVGWSAMFPQPKQAPPVEPVTVEPQASGGLAAESATPRTPFDAPGESTVVGTETESYAAADVVAASSEQRFTVDNQAKNSPLTTKSFESQNFFVGPA